MYKKTIQYTDFDGNPQSKTLYFNLSRIEITDNLGLEDRLKEMHQSLSGLERDLTTEEVRDILDLVKDFARLSYGVRSDDGERFIKSEELWTNFSQTAAYDEFLIGLFSDPTEAMLFLLGVIPQSLREEAEAKMAQGQLQLDTTPAATPKASEMSVEELMEEMRRRQAQA